jgi:UDP-3-O-[3-hydroxymyristoyl] N-acetylglucosamine deacetylase
VRGIWEAGLALGGELSGTLVLDGDGLPGPPPRFPDEAVRHKALDLLGDLALLGAAPRGRFTAVRSGHALHLAWVRKVLSLQDV